MKMDFLDILFCPSCQSTFQVYDLVEVQHLLHSDAQRMIYGVVRCGCAEYPVVDGILIFKRDEKTRQVLDYVARKKTWAALKQCFDYGPDLNRLLLATASNATLPYKALGLVLRLLTGAGFRRPIPLYKLLHVASVLHIDRFWTTYLKHRHSATSFWCSIPFIQLIDSNATHALDVGCGMGIFSWVLSKRVAEESIICQNLDFAGLYLARKYFVPNANFICSDFGEQQPLPDGFCDVVFSCDALAYVDDKIHACNEIARVLRRDGLLILAHNHTPSRRDYISQNGRGDFLDPPTASEIFKKHGVTQYSIDEQTVHESLFPLTDGF